MALKRIVESLDGMDEADKKHYVQDETEGHYEIEVIGTDEKPYNFKGVEDTIGALRKNEREFNALKKKLPKPIEEITKDLARLPELEAKASRTKEFFDKPEEERFNQMTKEMRENHSAAIQGYTTQIGQKDKMIEDLSKKVRSAKVENALDRAIAKVGIEAEFYDDVMLRTNIFDIIDDDTTGGQAISLLDAGGHPTRSAKDPTRYKDPEEWLMEQAKVKPKWFKASQDARVPSNSNRRNLGAGVRVIDGNDPEEFGRNLEEIAKGKVIVKR